jgi:WD40 repeat protein
MDNQLLLKTIEKLLLSSNPVGLSDVQILVLESTLAGASYSQIAGRSTYTVEYLREVGSKLWQTLAELLGEPISKKNLRSVLERYQQAELLEELDRKYFWGEAIDVSTFYGRDQELKILETWATQDHCRLIEILAIGGMGKTALAIKLAQAVAGQFDFVVWKSLCSAPLLSNFLAEVIAVLAPELEVEPTQQLTLLIDRLRQQRCLLIIDNIESILLAGKSHQYLAGYAGYGDFFRQVAECSHQSCVVLTSREQIAEVANYAGSNLPVRVLNLGGLELSAALSVLDDKGLPLMIEQGQKLVELYGGNPLALKIVSTSILEVFDGRVSEFLRQGIAVFNGIRWLIASQFDRLSQLETQVMFWLAINREWISVSHLHNDIFPAVSMSQLLESLEYLKGRSLIEKKDGRFTQQPVVMEYMTEKLVMATRTEIVNQNPQLLLSYALMKAQSKDYVRASQIRLILQPLLALLCSDLGGQVAVIQVCRQILLELVAQTTSAVSYGAGNCLNLLCQISADLTGLDLTGLSIRQADLRDVSLAGVNFTGANLSTTLFTESIGDIYKVVISPNDRLVAKGGSDGKLAIWEISSGQSLLNIKAHDGHLIGLVFTKDSKQLISSSFDRTIKIWEVESGRCLQSWQLAAPVYRIALSPDGTTLASSSNCGDILLWEVATGKLLTSLVGHSLTVVDVDFQLQGQLLVSSSFDSTIKIWDLATGKCLKTLVGHSQIVSCVNFNALGTELVSSGLDTSIKIWDVASGACLQTIQEHSRTVIDVLFTPNGQQIISGSQDLTVRIWDRVKAQDWQCSKVLRGHENNIWSIALNSQGTILVSSDQSGVLKFWDIESGQCVKTFSSISKAVRALAFHPQRNLLASSSEDRQIRLWDLDNYQCLHTIPAHRMAVWQIAFSPQGDVLASCGMDGLVKLWDVQENNLLEEHPQPILASPGFVITVAFHPQANILASGGVDIFGLWNYRTKNILYQTEQAELGDLAFHPLGKFVATACHQPDIKVWDVETTECYRVLQGHDSENWTVAFNPSGTLLASGGEDKSVRLWDFEAGVCRRVLTGHTAAIACVAFSPDGLYLASASKDYTIRIWQIDTGECIRVLTNHTDLVNFVVFHPDADRLLLTSCSHDQTIRLWDTDFWICTKVLRPQQIYEGMIITKSTGLTPSQIVTLKGLGAIDLDAI